MPATKPTAPTPAKKPVAKKPAPKKPVVAKTPANLFQKAAIGGLDAFRAASAH